MNRLQEQKTALYTPNPMLCASQMEKRKASLWIR
jgi:hypothetical protein